MYTILVTQENELITSVRERIMQRSKMVDSLHFLVDPTYKDLDMSGFTVRMELNPPISKEPRTELLSLSPELYMDKLEYKIPIDTYLTKEAGEVEIQLSFTKNDLDIDGNNVQYVRRTSPTTITVVPLSAWSNFVSDDALNALDSAFLQLESQLKYLESISSAYDVEKADDIYLDKNENRVYARANGKNIGAGISIEELSDSIIENNEDGLVTMLI